MRKEEGGKKWKGRKGKKREGERKGRNKMQGREEGRRKRKQKEVTITFALRCGWSQNSDPAL